MESFENLLLQHCSTEFLDMQTDSPWVRAIEVCSNGSNVKLYDLTIIMQ